MSYTCGFKGGFGSYETIRRYYQNFDSR